MRTSRIRAISVDLLCKKLFSLNTLRPRQDGRYFADDVLKCIFLNENVWISCKIPLKFVPRVQATSHYLNQCWYLCRRIYTSLGLNELVRRYASQWRERWKCWRCWLLELVILFMEWTKSLIFAFLEIYIVDKIITDNVGSRYELIDPIGNIPW